MSVEDYPSEVATNECNNSTDNHYPCHHETNIHVDASDNVENIGNGQHHVAFADHDTAIVTENLKDNNEIEDSIFSIPNSGSDISNDSSRIAEGKRVTSFDLRSNLTRTQIDRDPMKYYNFISVMGIGSMGSVTCVRKRSHQVGGSARQIVIDSVKREKQLKQCFTIPYGFGKLFQYCHGKLFQKDDNDSITDDNDAFIVPGYGDDSPYDDIESSPYTSTRSRSSPNRSGTDEQHHNDIVYAMKSIHLSRVTDETFINELKNEVIILKELDHPHIVRIIETFQYQKQIFVIMELCSGGDLYSRDPYTEDQAARICASVISAVAYVHSRGIIHRDLKYENVLFATPDPKSEIKLIDFGLSKYGHGDELTDGVGTIYTMAPEVLKGSYTKQADLWSVGVMAAMLLSSQMPFFGRKRSHIIEQIMEGKSEFKGKRWKRVSRQAKAFVSDLLVVDPNERTTAEEALQCHWLNRYYNMTTRDINKSVEDGKVEVMDEYELDEVRESLVRYAEYSKLRKVALMVIAHKSTSDEIGILRKVFQKYDKLRTGQVGYDQFKGAICQAGFSDSDIKKIFDAVDIDGTGKIRYTEFLAATIEARGAISEQRLAEAFDRLDSDDKGYISADNLRELLGADFPQSEIDAILMETSKRGDGKVTYSDFLSLWAEQNEHNRSQYMRELRDMHSLSSNSIGQLEVEDEVLSRETFIEAKQASGSKVKYIDV